LIPAGSTITHSHPEDYPLSLSDLLTASALQVAEIRAVGPNRGFLAKVPKSGWPSDMNIRFSYSRAMKKTDSEVVRSARASKRKLAESERDKLWEAAYTRNVRSELALIGVKLEEFDVNAQ